MAVCRVGSRGRITLPIGVRRVAQIQPGDTVSIRVVGPGKIEVSALPHSTPQELVDLYPIKGPVDIVADRVKWEAEAAKEVLSQIAREGLRETPGEVPR